MKHHNSLDYDSNIINIKSSSFNGQNIINGTHQPLESIHRSWKMGSSKPSSLDFKYIKLKEREADVTEAEKEEEEEEDCFKNHNKNWRTIQETGNMLKRKNLDADCNLDLNLSLKVTLQDGIENGLKSDRCDNEVNSSLSLSLSSSSSSKLSGLKQEDDEDGSRKHARRASTLGLTL